ncbi:glycosyltransferase family 4 protein [Thermoplasmatales archaeon AK]|nr:glycosyltransferase family 4 protein [Thermoplasmatales archaeon AK]
MKVAVIGWELPPAFSGGLGVHTLNLFSILAEAVDVTLYVPDVPGLGSSYNFGVRKVRIPARLRGKLPYSLIFEDFSEAVEQYNRRLVEEFDPSGIDLIHCHDWITFRAGMEIKRRYNIPMVVTVHSLETDRSGNFNPQRGVMEIERNGIYAADQVIAVSNYTKSCIVRDYGADPTKITPIHNGVDSIIYGLRDKDYRGTGQVLYFGRVTTQKGPTFFIRMAKRILEKYPETHFVVAGDGDQLSSIMDLSNQLNIQDSVKFLGFVDFQKSVEYYTESDVFVLPAVSEPFGMTVLESLVCGTPTVISRSTGVGEALHNVFRSEFWDTDLMANEAAAILRFRSIRETMGRRGKMEAFQFTWEKAAIKTMEVYRKACGT